MACSFFEGYLVHIIPNDGARFVGFEENITIYEAAHQVVFPVRRLFIVITKSLFCPPDLKHFNKPNKSLPYIEACEVSDKVYSVFISFFLLLFGRNVSVFMASYCLLRLLSIQ